MFFLEVSLTKHTLKSASIPAGVKSSGKRDTTPAVLAIMKVRK
jgi:hypothetical protein